MGCTSQLLHTTASGLMCVTHIASPKKPGNLAVFGWPCCAVLQVMGVAVQFDIDTALSTIL